MSKPDTIDEIFDLYKAAISNDSGTAWEQEERISEAKAALSAMVAEIIGERIDTSRMKGTERFTAECVNESRNAARQRAIAKGFTLNKEDK